MGTAGEKDIFLSIIEATKALFTKLPDRIAIILKTEKT